MTSQVDIARMALSLLGDDIDITSLNDPTKQAVRVKLVWDHCLETLLRAYPWRFALKRYSLAKSTDKLAFGDGNIFVYPSDCLRIWKVEGNCDYTVEGDRIISSADTFNFIGIFKNTNTTKFSSDFVQCLIYLLASEICLSINGDISLKNNLYEQYLQLLDNAQTTNSYESTAERYSVHGYLDSRKIGAW